jgi:hypothetical protein
MAGLIEDYALIGDMQSAALVGRPGSPICLASHSDAGEAVRWPA